LKEGIDMMRVVRMRRGWRLQLTDNEMEMLQKAVLRGLVAFRREGVRERLPYKVRKVLSSSDRWELPHGPLVVDEDRRPA
jgi:hypothetical protein